MALTAPVSLCMIARNEEVFLDAALKSVKSVLGLDEIIVVDTGSTDMTREIALENGALVFDFEWCDDFSAARNFAAEKAKNDWILVMDADEEVLSTETDELETLFNEPRSIGSVTRVELSDKATSRESRLYNRKYHRYAGSIHEQIEPFDNIPKKIKEVSILIAHYGYLPEFKRVDIKLKRNEKLLIKELDAHPDDPYLLYQLGQSYFCNDRDLTSACDCFELALSSAPDARLEYVYCMVESYGYALINTGQYDKALALMGKYAEHYNGKPQFRFLSAHIYQNNAMLIEAVECYESCIGAETIDYSGITSYLSYYNIGVILECIEMTEDAIRMYNNCGDYEPALKRLAELQRHDPI